MSVVDILSLIPVTELLKLVISKVKKVKNFKPLFKELASTMQRLVPIIQEMDTLQERVHPGNEELNFLTETLRRAEKIVGKCSRVREYDARKKITYAETIKGINEDFVKFCQLDLPLIQHRNMLRSLSQKMEDDSPPPLPEHNTNVSTRDEGKEKQEDEQLAAAIQESLNMQELDHLARQKSILRHRRQEQQVILESFKDKGKGKQLQEDEQVAAAIQESLKMQELDHLARQKSILRHRQQEQQVILESCKDKGKGKQLHQEDEQVAAAIQESLKMQELDHLARQKSIFRHRQQEQVAKRSARELGKDEQYDEIVTTYGSSSSTRAPSDIEDVQRILWESFKNKGNRKAI